MSQILIANGLTFDRDDLLPQDTPLACPACNAHTIVSLDGLRSVPAVEARAPREVWKFGARKQDRQCNACGYQWASILPPAHETGGGTNGTVSLHRV